MRLWRLVRRAYAGQAFTGEGARRFGGRWNSPGVAVTYTSSSLALAALETFVNLEPKRQPADLVSLEADLPERALRERVGVDNLPGNWKRAHPERLRALGDAWVERGRSVALIVPSAVVDGEANILLNPLHPDMAAITIGRAVRFRFDARMFSDR